MSGERVYVNGLGAVAELTLPNRDFAVRVREAWADCLIDPPKRKSIALSMSVEQEMIDRNGDDLILEHLTQTVTNSLIGLHQGERLMLHACAVGDQASAAGVVLVGPSGVGKTTMARTLGTSWSYLTDECVALDEEFLALPYAKPLSVIEPGKRAKQQRSASSLGMAPFQGLMLAQAVVLLQRDAAVGELEVEEVSDGAGRGPAG